jgi:hypothetical protein
MLCTDSTSSNQNIQRGKADAIADNCVTASQKHLLHLRLNLTLETKID